MFLNLFEFAEFTLVGPQKFCRTPSASKKKFADPLWQIKKSWQNT